MHLFLLVSLILTVTPVFSQPIVISEVQSSNLRGYADEDDWIELYNPFALPVDVSGYYISDDPLNKTKHRLPISEELVVPANGYLLLWADNQPMQGATHLPFRLNAQGEFMGLYRPEDESVVDFTYFPEVEPNLSYARNGDGNSLWVENTPTPNAANWVVGNPEAPKILPRTVYPNPTSGFVRFSRQGSGNMVDLSGRQVLTFNQTMELDASCLPRGTYIMLFDDGDRKRLVIAN